MICYKRSILILALTALTVGVIFHLATLNSRRIVKTEFPPSLHTGRDVAAVYSTLSSGDEFLVNISRPYYHIVPVGDFPVKSRFLRLRETQVSHIPHTFFIDGRDICKDKAGPETLFVIPSIATQAAAQERLMIRKTWAEPIYDENYRQTSSPERVVFFFGGSGLDHVKIAALGVESMAFRDVVVADFKDSYHNLSLKMATAITWVARNCPTVSTVIKVDMDTYVNIGSMLSLVEQLPARSHPRFMFGNRHRSLRPPVVRGGQWAVKRSEYRLAKYPRYLYGHSYVISRPAVKKLADSFPYFPIIPNEDAFITGLMAVALNITRFYHPSFALPYPPRYVCDMVYNKYVSALVKPTNTLFVWGAMEGKHGCLFMFQMN